MTHYRWANEAGTIVTDGERYIPKDPSNKDWADLLVELNGDETAIATYVQN